MKAIYGLSNLKRQSHQSVISVGVFDGVHIGHKRIVKEVIKQAKRLNLEPLLVTFKPHPAKVIKKSSTVAMLSSFKHRLKFLEELGIETCLVIRFNKAFSQKSAKGFIQKILVDKLRMKILVVGENFSFGREQLHNAGTLKAVAKDLNFGLITVRPKRHNSRTISSSLIRHLIEDGKIKDASRLLGRPVSILGTVVKGRQIGRTIGFKTANIDPHHEAIPPSGVYAAYTKLDKKIYMSILNIGTRPTFKETEPTIEVHLFDFSGKLYNREIEVCFVKRLRAERRFKNKDHLCEQIAKDASLARSILSKRIYF